MSQVRVLMIGDVFAKPGRNAVRSTLPALISSRNIDFTVANGENIAGGIGITPELADELFDTGVNVITSGNHIWRKKEIRSYIDNCDALLRPCNYVPGQPGKGWGLFETAAGIGVGVINAAGQIYMDVQPDNPFKSVDSLLNGMSGAGVIIVDFHAEATSEKRAMGYYLDGRISALFGTHTHIQTSDESILPCGTAYITDVGMTGPHCSIIGMRKGPVIEKFSTGMPVSFKPAKDNPRFQGAIVDVDIESGRAVSMERLDLAVRDR